MLVLAGLGNPGAQYARNRHNVGFMAMDAIAALHGFSAWRSKFQAALADGEIAGRKTLLLKPQTYMNRSGDSLAGVVRFYKIEPKHSLFVFHDELDLAPAKVKVKLGGGHAGHNGLRSIDSHLGPHYGRVRLGIGHPGQKHLVHKYVLSDFTQDDGKWLVAMIAALAQEAPLLVKGDTGAYMSRVAMHIRSETQPPKPSGMARGQTANTNDTRTPDTDAS